MADKEPYDRAAPLHLTPQLTRKEKRPHDEPADDSARPTNGFYLSATAHKAKLMLPTALWILLFIAGICFLTLLASLNKTIGTLDTLVEMEQAKEARAALGESLNQRPRDHHHHHNHPHRQHHDNRRADHKSARLTKAHMSEPRADLDVSATDDWRSASASWFAAPSWTSLEPRQAAPPADFVAEIVPLGDARDGNFMVASSEPLDPAMMSQVVPIFESLAGGPREPQLARAQPESPATGSAPMISAKIDNVHVHINGLGEAADNKKSGAEVEDINSLEKSIDQLVGKLMDQHEANRKQAHNKEQLLPVFPQIDDLLPPPGPLHHNSRRPPSLSQLLGPGPNSMFLQEEPMVVLPLPQPIEPHHKPHQKPADQLIVAFSDELKPPPSRETNRHNLSNTRRPTPYELTPPMGGNLMSPFDLLAGPIGLGGAPIKPSGDKKHDAPWDMLATDLADSLVQGMFQQMQAQPHKPPTKGAHPDESQFVVISDGMPGGDMPAVFSQILGPQVANSKSSEARKQPKKDDDLSDIVNLFFGPSRQWEKEQNKPSIRITDKPITDSVTGATIGPVASGSSKKSAEPSDKQLEQLISQLPTSGPLSRGEEKLIRDDMGGDMFTDLIGTMFSLPQMSGNSPPVSTSSARPNASGPPAGINTGTTQATKTTTTTTTPTSSSSTIAAVTSTKITTVAPKRIQERPIVTKLTIEPFKSASKVVSTIATTTTKMPPRSTTTSISSAPIVKVISELDTPSHMPVIDLAPFARSKNALDEPKTTTTTATTTTTKDNLISTTPGKPTTSSSQANSTLVELLNHNQNFNAMPPKNFFEKADEFIERNFLNLKRVFQ